jgi:starvation-inducible DNA-binding protein
MNKPMTAPTYSPEIASGLKDLLADTYALMAQTHVAHWNVEGPGFFQLHAAFQTQYEELFEAVDEVAERLRALDVLAPGGLSTLAAGSVVAEIPIEQIPARAYVEHLLDSHELLLERAANLRDAAGEAGDKETEDLAIGRIQSHQKTVWMLKSFLKES